MFIDITAYINIDKTSISLITNLLRRKHVTFCFLVAQLSSINYNINILIIIFESCINRRRETSISPSKQNIKILLPFPLCFATSFNTHICSPNEPFNVWLQEARLESEVSGRNPRVLTRTTSTWRSQSRRWQKSECK